MSNYLFSKIKNFVKSLDEQIIKYFSDLCMRFGLLCWTYSFFLAVGEIIKGNFEKLSAFGFVLVWMGFELGVVVISGGAFIMLIHIKWRQECL